MAEVAFLPNAALVGQAKELILFTKRALLIGILKALRCDLQSLLQDDYMKCLVELINTLKRQCRKWGVVFGFHG